MKKYLFILFLFLVTVPGYSQIFGWGFTGGPNFVFASGQDFNGDAFVGSEVVSLAHAGFIFQYHPRRFFTLYSGAEFSMKGANLNSRDNALGYGGNINQLRLNYLEIPLFVKLNFDQYSDIRPNIFAGPTLAFLLAGRDNFLLDNAETPKPLMNTERYYRSFDPGFALGAGLDLDVGEWAIVTLGIQYTHGFRNVADTESIFISENAEFYNRNFRMNFGLIFVIPTYTMNRPGKKDVGFKKFKKYVN